MNYHIPDTVADLLRIGEGETWVRELPGKPNDSPRIREYQKVTGNAPPDSWCMSYQLWLQKEAKQTITGLKVSGACEEVRRSARKLKMLYPYPIPGAIGLLIDVKHDHAHHTFRVTSEPVLKGNNAFATNEGNTNPNGGREGYGVFNRERDMSGKLKYEFVYPSNVAFPVLTLGDTGYYVKLAQQILGVTADGEYGQQTHKAVTEFYTRRRIVKMAYYIGPEVWAEVKSV